MAAAVVTGLLGIAGPPASAEPGGMVISELHYHPGSDLDTDDFIELTNTGPSSIDISGWSFTEGIGGVLPAGSVVAAGGRYVAAADSVRFAQLYGRPVDAVYTGKLSNGGETITLADTGLAVVDTVTYADAPPWPAGADGLGPSLELRGLLYDNTLPESWGASTVAGGTPGAVNSINGTAPVPMATAVVANPQRPDPGQAIVVSARLPLGSTATLAYKVMFAADVVVPFRDDAASLGGADDGQFSATIPGQTAGRLVRYRISAVSSGVTFTHPTADDGATYEGVVVRNPSVVTTLPVIEWFMQDSVYNDLLANHRFDDVEGDAVIAYNGTVWDGARMRIRGNTSRTRPKVSWKIDMPAGRDFDMPGLPYPLDEFALQREREPVADVGWNTVGAGGARRLAIIPVRTQRNGAFWSVGHVMETEDGSWRKDQGVSDWAIYKGDGGSLARTSSPAALESSLWLDKKTREDEDFTDAWQLSQAIDASASAAQKAWIMQNVNVPELINYMAINSVMRHADSGWYNWWIARDTEGTGRWEMWHWDLNWVFTTPAEDGKGTFLTPDTSNKFTIAMLAYPDFRSMFMRRLRTLADQLLAPGRYEAEWDGIVTPYLSDWALDRSLWGGYLPSAQRDLFLASLADRRAVIANNTGPGKPVPASQSAAPAVVINEIAYHPATGDQGEFIELYNPSSTESVDLSGWTLDPVGLTIQPGTVLLPRSYAVVVKDDVAFRGTHGGSNRLVVGHYAGSLDDAGATVTLRQGSRVADTVTYSPDAPWPTAAAGGGPSLELLDAGLDNALPSSWTATSAAGGTPGLANSGGPAPDTTPPSAPTGLTASALTSGQVTLSWNAATDDRGVTAYEVRRGATPLPRVSGLSLTDTGLAPATSYSYTVRAYDAAGNESASSAALVVTTPPSGGGALFSDTWSGANGSPWSSSWTPSVGSGSVTSSGGAGVLAITDVANSYARATLTGLAARADSQVLFSYRWSAGTPSAYFNVYSRGSGGWANGYRPRNGYGLEFTSNSTSVLVRRVVNGTATVLATAAGAQVVGSGTRWVRLRVSGSTIQVRTWADGQAEPVTWNASVTDTSVTAPGQLFVSVVRGSSNTGVKSVSLDNLTISLP